MDNTDEWPQPPEEKPKAEEPPPRRVTVYNFDGTPIIITFVVAATLALLLYIGGWIGVSVTRADREYRTAKVEQCGDIRDESIRTLCVSGG